MVDGLPVGGSDIRKAVLRHPRQPAEDGSQTRRLTQVSQLKWFIHLLVLPDCKDRVSRAVLQALIGRFASKTVLAKPAPLGPYREPEVIASTALLKKFQEEIGLLPFAFIT